MNTILGKTILVVLLSISVLSCSDNALIKRPGKDSGTLPALNILLTDTVTKFNTSKLPVGKPTMIFFFGPDCPYCDTLANHFVTHIDSLKDIQMLMLSAAYFHDAKTYEAKYDINKYRDNIILGLDYDAYFNLFQPSGLPLLVLFDKNKKMKRANLGPLSIDSIKKIINK
jgi:thioredoxin-related protein